MEKLAAFWKDEEGATAVEYGIIAGLMAILLMAIFGEGQGSFGSALKTAFSNIAGLVDPTAQSSSD